MTPDELARLRALCEFATDGPWKVIGQDGDALGGLLNAVPALLAEVERLTAERDDLAAKVARVEALADKWWNASDWSVGRAEAVRAALAGDGEH